MTAFRSQASHGAAGIDLLPPERGSRGSVRSTRRAADIVDVEFETLSPQHRRSVHPVFNDNNRSASVSAKQAGGAKQAEGGRKGFGRLLHGLEGLLQRASPRVFALLVTCLCAPVFAAFASLSDDRQSVPASPALSFSGVTTMLGDANGMKVVSVYGAVENRSNAPRVVPTIQVDIIAGGQTRTAGTIVAGEGVLAPGGTRLFSTRLPHAGGKLPEVKLSFGQKG